MPFQDEKFCSLAKLSSIFNNKSMRKPVRKHLEGAGSGEIGSSWKLLFPYEYIFESLKQSKSSIGIQV